MRWGSATWRMLVLVIGLVLSVASAGPRSVGTPDANGRCSVGKRCGDTCIARDKTCRLDQPSSTSSGPTCKKGKRCGNACIPVDRTCHK